MGPDAKPADAGQPEAQAQPQPTETPPPAPEPTPDELDAQLLAEAAAEVKFIPDSDETPAEAPKPDAKPADAATTDGNPPDDDILAAAATERRKLAEERKGLKLAQDEVLGMQKQLQGALELIKKDPAAFMEKHAGPGWFNQVASKTLTKNEPETEATKIERLEKTVRDLIGRLDTERTQASHGAYMDSIWDRAANDEKYELVAADSAMKSHVETFVHQYREMHGFDLPVERVLDYALEVQTERLKQLPAKALQAILGIAAPDSKPEQPTTDNGEPPDAGITNAQPPRGIPPVEDDFDPFDDEARFNAAVAEVKFDPE